jgi:hypothetical protein
MNENTITTAVDATATSFTVADEIAAKEIKLDALANELEMDRYTEILRKLRYASERNNSYQQSTDNNIRKIQELKEYLTAALLDSDIDEEVAGTIADIFNIELTETSVMTLTIEVTIVHPIGKRGEIDESDIDITIDGGYSNGVEVESYETVSCDVNEG